jgi:hypothetical protein
MSAHRNTSEPQDDGTRSVPATGDEIAAEIADHLATATERLQARGVAPDAAQQQAAKKFGDAAAIGRRCYWIQHGDSLMFRYAVIALLSLLCLGLTITAIASWQSQARMAKQMAALTEQLKVLAERPPAPPVPMSVAPVEPIPLEIVGNLYVGSPDKPAANREVTIVSAQDGSVVRRVMSDANGKFRSSPLAAGDYSLICPVQPPYVWNYRYVQSAPQFLHPGVRPTTVSLDVGPPSGRLALELSRPLPRASVNDKYTIDSRLMVKVVSPQMQNLSWTSTQEMPPVWPLYVARLRSPSAFSRAEDRGGGRGGTFGGGRSGSYARSGFEFYELLSNEDLTRDWGQTLFADQIGRLPPGNSTVVAVLLADVIPTGHKPPAIKIPNPLAASLVGPDGGMSVGGPGRSGRGSPPDADTAVDPQLLKWQNAAGQVLSIRNPHSLAGDFLTTEDDNFWWLTKGLGKLWLTHLTSGGKDPNGPPEPHAISQGYLAPGELFVVSVPVSSQQITRLRIEIPDDLESRIKALVESTLDSEEFSKQTIPGIEPLPAKVQEAILQGDHPFLRRVKMTVVGTEPLREPAESSDE